jgi:hypothetical protein
LDIANWALSGIVFVFYYVVHTIRDATHGKLKARVGIYAVVRHHSKVMIAFFL